MTSTSDRSSTSAERVIEEAHRADWGRLLARLVARTRRLDLAEDALGEAFARASDRWPGDGVPANPTGWLYTTAFRYIVGRVRAEAIAGRNAPLLAVKPDWVGPVDVDEELADDRLHLILLCCHPALPESSRSALALRLVIGTSTEDIARLFLVSTATMAARLTRAKKKIVATGIPLGDPLPDELHRRLDDVCRTIYLGFTAGYTPGTGADLLRADLAADALRLALILHELVPEEPQVRALVALLILQHARRDARVVDGCLITLASQDRSKWRKEEIQLGLGLVHGFANAHGYAAVLQLEASIAAEHSRAATAEATDWNAIAGHYATLEALTGSPIVRLNRAVAVAEALGPAVGLSLLAGLDELLPGNHRFQAVRADLAHRAGDVQQARDAYRAAIRRCGNDVERHYLHSRLAGLEVSDG